MAGFVFDCLVIGSAVEVSRPVGPLEEGAFDNAGSWVASADAVRVGGNGFGIDGTGRAYFDTAGPDEGEHAVLWVDASTSALWLEVGS